MFQQTKIRRGQKCPIPKSTFRTYMDEGIMHYRAGHYRKSLFCFDRALELQSTNKVALVARSQCHLKLGDAASALKDAETSFDKEDTTSIMGLYQYAEALFNLGQFEKALIAYHRGLRMGRDMEGFRIGIQKSQEAIRRAIEDKQATQIEDLDVILPMIEEMESMLNQKKDHCCIRPNSNEASLQRKIGLGQKPPSKERARWVDREILGQLQRDKDYFTKFLARPDIQSEQGGSGSEALRSSATEALQYLEIRKNTWRQQKPMYARRVGLNFNNDMVVQHEQKERERQEASRKIKMVTAEGAVLKNLDSIDHSLKIGRPKDCQLECERTIRQIKDISTRLLPRKAEFMAEVLHFKGLALMKLKLFDQAATSFQNELLVATENRIIDAKSRALDHLGKAHAMKGSYADAADFWDSRLSLAKSSLQSAYLNHEIGRCYYEMNKPDVAKSYGNQALEEANKINDQIWSMNALILLGQCDIKAMNLEGAINHFEAAEVISNLQGNKVATNFLREAQQCLLVWLEKRENTAGAEVRMGQKSGSDESIGDYNEEGARKTSGSDPPAATAT